MRASELPANRNTPFCREMDEQQQAILFSVNSTALDAVLHLRTTAKDFAGCVGRLVTRECTLRPGVVEYAVTLTNDTIALQTSDRAGDRYLGDTAASKSALSAASYTSHMLFPSVTLSQRWRRNGDSLKSLMTSCMQATNDSTCDPKSTTVRDTSLAYLEPLKNDSYEDLCDRTWRDPMEVSRRAVGHNFPDV